MSKKGYIMRFIQGTPCSGEQVKASLKAIGGKKFTEIESQGISFEDPNVFFTIGSRGTVTTIPKPSPLAITSGAVKQIMPHDFLFDTGDRVKVVSGDNQHRGETLTIKNRMFSQHGKPGYTFTESHANSPMAESNLELVERAHTEEQRNLFSGIDGQEIPRPRIGFIFYMQRVYAAASAMIKIAELMPEYGGAIADDEWADADYTKHAIRNFGGEIEFIYTNSEYYLLAFHTEKQSRDFYRDHKQLVKDILMINEND